MSADTIAETTIEMELPRAVVLSSNDRLHWRAKAERTKRLRQLGFFAARRDGHKFDKATVTVQVGYPDRRRHDPHNLQPTIKAILDGYVDASLLPDDCSRHLTALTFTEADQPTKNYGHIHLTITIRKDQDQ